MVARPAARRMRRALSRWPSLLLGVFSVLVLGFLIAPILLVIPMSLTGSDYLEFPPRSLSLRWYRAYFDDADWIDPTWLSFKVAALTALTSTVLGALAALALVRSRLVKVSLVSAIVTAPIVTPAIILAVALLLALSRLGLVGETLGFVLAHSVLALPLVVLTVTASLQRIDERLESVALSLGASLWTTIVRITLPLAAPGILVGAAFAFITSFDEATVSFFLSTASGKTLPKKMFEGIEWELSPIIAAVSTLLTLISMALVVVLALAQRAERGTGSRPAQRKNT